MLHRAGDHIECAFERGHLDALGREPELAALAGWLMELFDAHGASALLIDGPQAWKDADEGRCQRVCEKVLATPGKTGLPGVVLPRSWTRFAAFSIELFDALAVRGLARSERAFESFPTASWRALGERPLPGKGRCKADGLRARADVLVQRFGVRFTSDPSHDELQAAVAGLAGIAREGHPGLAFALRGSPPVERYGAWREGEIALAVPANSSR